MLVFQIQGILIVVVKFLDKIPCRVRRPISKREVMGNEVQKKVGH